MPFQKGQSGNPAGRPSGHQTFIDRAKYWLETKTVGEINDLLNDEKRWGKLCAFDAIIIMRISEACKTGGCKAMNHLLDRVLI